MAQCGTFAFTLELTVAAPYHLAIGVRRMPDFLTEEASAVAADQFGREYTVAAVGSAQRPAAGNLRLHHVPFQRVNDGCMAPLYIVLWNLALI